ncbi:GNAT family N-acetyltransferase [Actinomadura sp. SCN-SB]|uniref:GNAT family N-acetyltransferase n=1 Tax=Actinomadura sp. SCN-SB TaxID=3373092 RepID=UPI003751C4C4
MRTTERTQATLRRLGEPGDLGWVVMAHGELYATEYGWNTDFEALVGRIVADYAGGGDDERRAAWIAELDGRRVGCVFCVPADEKDGKTAKLRLLLVDPSARGHGIGSRLVGECLNFAKEAGYQDITLWTNDVLVSARRIYQAYGFQLVDEKPHHSFGKDLVGQDWSRPL